MYNTSEVSAMPRNKYPEETVKKILDASAKLFLEKGFEQTTILDIVDNLGGLTRGAFYHHFKSKEEVLEALVEKLFGDSNPFERVMRDDNGLNGLDKVKMIMKYSVERQFSDSERTILSNAYLSLLSNPRFLAVQVKDTQEVSCKIEPMIAEGMADGSIKPGNPKFLAELFMLLINIWLLPTIYPCDEQEAMEKIMMIKQVLDGMGFPIIDEEVLAGFGHVLGKLEY